MAKMPQVLKNFNCSVDGRGYAGIADEVVPPKLTIKSEEHRAGGMDAPVDIDMGMEKLSLEFTLSQYDKDVLKLFGVNNGATVPFTLRGALQADGGDVTPVVINARGMFSEIDAGTWKAGEKTQMKCSVSLRYYKLTIAGEIIAEIDVENMTRIVGGEDHMAAIRDAIGL